MSNNYWMPTIPYGPIDMLNRRAAATGSVSYAQKATHADYNGHRIDVAYRPHAVGGPRWTCTYWWGGRVVLGRGSFETCLQAGIRKYQRGALGTEVIVSLSDEAPESIDAQRQACEAAGLVPFAGNETVEAHRQTFWTDRHDILRDALKWERNRPDIMGLALQFEGTFAEWEAARDKHMGKVKCKHPGCKTYWFDPRGERGDLCDTHREPQPKPEPDPNAPPAGSWAETARMMAQDDDSGFDWDAWKDQMKEGDL